MLPRYDDRANLPEDDKILAQFRRRSEQHMIATENWRSRMRDDFMCYDGMQWVRSEYDRYEKNHLNPAQINQIAKIIDVASGFEIQNPLYTRFSPRLMTQQQIGFSDLAQTGVDYISENTDYTYERACASRDMYICGIGVTDTFISYDRHPDGEVRVERFFPFFALWDAAAREKNIRDRNWCARARIMNREELYDMLPELLDGESNDSEAFFLNYYNKYGTGSTTTVDGRFLEFYSATLATQTLVVAYDYYWRQREYFYRVMNPFQDMRYRVLFQNNPVLIAAYSEFAQQYQFDPLHDREFSISKQDRAKVRKFFESFGLPYEDRKHRHFRYYRALIIGDTVIDKGLCFSQTAFPLNFMTGKFAESTQEYYGMVKDAKEPQRIYNRMVTDLLGYIESIPKGGVFIEADAVDTMQAFKDTYTLAREVTVLASGGLSKILPKQPAPLPEGVIRMMDMMRNAVFEVCGLTPEFLGAVQSKNMTARLQDQQVQQGLMVLAFYLLGTRLYSKDQAEIFLDGLRVMAENNPGRLIRNVTGDTAGEYIPLLENGIAQEYDIIIDEIAQNPNQKQKRFEQLLELATVLGQPEKMLPVLMNYAPMRPNEIQTIQQLYTPEPVQPDPVQQALLEAQIVNLQADAEKKQADAIKTRMEALLKQKELQGDTTKNMAEVEKLQSETDLNQAKTMKTLQETVTA